MGTRFLYIYLMAQRSSDKIAPVAPLHAAYWQRLGLPGYVGGPFADRTGGMITFVAEGPADAEAAVASDPFVVERLLERSWVKAWEPSGTGDPADHLAQGLARAETEAT
jgi:uncharacterized protein YciI